MFTKTESMPVFWPEAARAQLGEERWQRALPDPDSVDLLAWNVFQTLETHADGEWLAYRMQMFGGTEVSPPVRFQMWIGRDAEPLLTPSRAYARLIAERVRAAGFAEADVSSLTQPIEVPVRIEAPAVVCLVDTTMRRHERGSVGRDRLLEIIDAGLDHVRRLGKSLAVAVVGVDDAPGAAELRRRLQQLADPDQLAAELPHREPLDAVTVREVGWRQLLAVWEAEVDYLDLPASPRPFLAHLRRRGLL